MIGFSDEAVADLDHIRDYSARKYGAAATIRMGNRIFSALRRLEQSPYIGRVGREQATRELVIAPYVAIYAPTADGIAVYRVIHTAMQWPPKSDDSSLP